MELRIFGPGGTAEGQFEKDLKTLFAVDPKGWELLANWFITTDSLDPENALSSPAIIASTLVPEQFTASVNAVKYLLEAWYLYGLELADIQRDLMVLGYPADQVERLGGLLRQLERVKQTVYAEFMRFEHENAVLPMLEDIDVVCDVRPIFEDYAYPIPEKARVSHTRLLGFSYMVLMELVAKDFEGRSHKLSFQMTEGTLADFKAALQRTTDQLDTLKKRTRALSDGDF
jgi:hypothetical protein